MGVGLVFIETGKLLKLVEIGKLSEKILSEFIETGVIAEVFGRGFGVKVGGGENAELKGIERNENHAAVR